MTTTLRLGTFTSPVLLEVARVTGALLNVGLDVVEQAVPSSPAQFRSFMFRVARNRLYDRLRSELKVGEQVDLSEASLHELGASPSSVVARAQRVERKLRRHLLAGRRGQGLRRLLQRLRPPHRFEYP